MASKTDGLREQIDRIIAKHFPDFTRAPPPPPAPTRKGREVPAANDRLGKGVGDLRSDIESTTHTIVEHDKHVEERKRKVVEAFAAVKDLDVSTLLEFAKGVYLDQEFALARELYEKVLELEPDNQDAKFFLKRIDVHLGKRA